MEDRDVLKATDLATAVAALGLAMAGGGIPAIGLATITFLRPFLNEAIQNRYGHWAKALLEGKGKWEAKTPEEIQGLIAAKLQESPAAKEAVWAAAKAVMDSISDEAAEIIGSLTAEYVQDEKDPDPFFRGTVRTLADLTTSELVILRALVNLGAQATSPRVRLTLSEQEKRVERDGPLRPPEANHISLPGAPADIRRVMRLLKTNDIGRDAPTGGFVGRGGPDVMLTDLAALHRLKRYLG